MKSVRHDRPADIFQVVALFRDEQEAGRAANDIRLAGLPVGPQAHDRDATRVVAAEGEMADEANRAFPFPAVSIGTESMTKGWIVGTAIGAAVGGVVGLVAGAFTLTAGWMLVGLVVGAATGATIGFILGGSFGGIQGEGRPARAEFDDGGRLLSETAVNVGYRAPDARSAEEARKILERHDPIRVTVRR